MKPRVLLILAALIAPRAAFAGGAITEARAVSSDPAGFDGGRARPEGEFVRAGDQTDLRTPAQIARDEQVKADVRSRATLTAKTPGDDKELEPPKPKEWLKRSHIFMGIQGAVIGLLVGSLWGMTGLGIGILVGGLIGYALSRLTA